MNQNIVVYEIAEVVEEKRRDWTVIAFVNDHRATIEDLEVLRDRILNGKDEVIKTHLDKWGHLHFTTV